MADFFYAMKKKTSKKAPKVKPGNPADDGVDHNLSQGKDKDQKESYIQKQESRSGRGIDNEDTA
jgi:hypothetical protein